MTRTPLRFLLPALLLSLALAACSRAAPSVATPSPALPAATTAPALPAPTLPPSASPTGRSTTAARPSPTLTPAGPEPIQPGNAGRLVELDRLGLGALNAVPFFAPDGLPIYSPDGRWLALPTSAGVYLYDAATLEPGPTVPQGTAFIAFSPDGGRLALSVQGAVTLWDPATGQPTGRLPGDPDVYYWELGFSPDGALLAAENWNNTIDVWSVSDERLRYSLPGNRLSFSPDGTLAAVNEYGENRIVLYDTTDGAELNRWSAHSGGFAPGGQLWLEDEEGVRLVYVDRDLVSAPFRGRQPAFSTGGDLMALFADRQIWLYDPLKGRRVRQLEGSYYQTDGVLFSPDGQTLAAGVYNLRCPTCSEIDGLDRTLALWRQADGALIAQTAFPAGWMAYSTDGGAIAMVGVEDVQFLDTADGSSRGRLEGFTAPVAGLALSPDGETLAAIHDTEPYSLRLWDLNSGRTERTLLGRERASALYNLDMAYSPDGRYLALFGDVWDLAAGDHWTDLELAIVEQSHCASSAMTFSPDGAALATGCYEGQLDLWRLPDGAFLKRIPGYTGWVVDLAYSPDGGRLAAAYSDPDNRVQVWELPAGIPATAVTGAHYIRVIYSPEGDLLATVAANPEHEQYGRPAGYVQLWDAENGKERLKLDVDDAVSIAFSPDGRVIATGSLDGTLRLWDAAEGGLLLETPAHQASITELAFTPDGLRLAAGSLDGTISVWGTPGAAHEASWQTYTSDRFGFSIDYPPGWQALEVPNETYLVDAPQVWFSTNGWPPPQTGARADIVLMLLDRDPAPDWTPEKFEDYRAETVRIGGREALRVSGVNKESLYPETALIVPVGERWLLALPNGSPESLAVFDRVLNSLR